MKFKVGDKVRVVKVTINPCKRKYIGEIFTVKSLNPNGNNAYSKCHYGVLEDRVPYVFLEDELEFAPFTKQDLKDGMVVELCDGTRRVYLNNHFMGLKCFTNIHSYTDTLECKYEGKTINKVYVSQSLYLNNYFEDRNLILIWERPKEEPVKEMTVKEIEKELGYKVKIVSDSENKEAK